MWEGIDSQDVGLEAAIIERKRNSSLVESSCAEDVTGLKLCTEATDSGIRNQGSGISMKETGFEDLDVFRRAYRISLEVHRVSLEFPRIEQYALADQVRRASKGICANIAEGHGKRGHSKAEFRRYILIGIGSADEMRVWIRYCYDLGYIEEERWKRWRDEYEELARMLQGLSRSLDKGLADT